MSGNGAGKKKPAVAAAAATREPTTGTLFPGILPSDTAAVDDLLRAAEDDLLLNLRVDAHSTGRPSSLISSAASSSASLDSDLARRFEALRSAPPPPTASSAAAAARPASKAAPDDNDEWGRILGDDLAARFAALKGTSPAAAAALNPVPDGEGRGVGSEGPVEEEDDEVDEDGVSKKEIEKLMQWAKDAARLDPSTKSDEEEEDDLEEEEEEMETRKKKLQQRKEQQEKTKPRKWFFL